MALLGKERLALAPRHGSPGRFPSLLTCPCLRVLREPWKPVPFGPAQKSNSVLAQRHDVAQESLMFRDQKVDDVLRQPELRRSTVSVHLLLSACIGGSKPCLAGRCRDCFGDGFVLGDEQLLALAAATYGMPGLDVLATDHLDVSAAQAMEPALRCSLQRRKTRRWRQELQLSSGNQFPVDLTVHDQLSFLYFNGCTGCVSGQRILVRRYARCGALAAFHNDSLHSLLPLTLPSSTAIMEGGGYRTWHTEVYVLR